MTATETRSESWSDELQKPFKPSEIGKLPRIICPACTKAHGKACPDHPKSKCNECGGYLTPRHIHLDFVSHGDVTRRLLEVDPLWSWEPVAFDESGLPALDHGDDGSPVGMWIKLTVMGVSRFGYGSVPSDQSDAVKVLIGDALRNAAMRFGVALDLWSKGDRANPEAENAISAPTNATRRRTPPKAPAPAKAADDPGVLRAQIAQKGRKLGLTLDDIGIKFADENDGLSITAASTEQLVSFRDDLPEADE